MRPTRIDQIIPSIVEHDAVSNHTFSCQRLLRELGFDSEVYAHILGPGTEGRVRPLSQFSSGAEDHWVLYQCSIGSPAAEVFRRHRGRKLLDYHNISPTELVERWLPPLGAETRLGRRQLAELASIVDFAVADSPYNANELVAAGYRHVEVVPVLLSSANLDATPDASVLSQLKGRPGTDWLFVGQIAPHKAQHDVVKAFSRFRARYDPTARLHLVGREMGNAYRAAVTRFVSDLGLDSAVDLPGSVSTDALVAYYQACDVFVCLSDHEGFCVPLIEAMAQGLPVVAHAAAAVPDTVGGAGVLLEDKSPELVAAVVDELMSAPELCRRLSDRGRQAAAVYSVERGEQTFRSAIATALDLLA